MLQASTNSLIDKKNALLCMIIWVSPSEYNLTYELMHQAYRNDNEYNLTYDLMHHANKNYYFHHITIPICKPVNKCQLSVTDCDKSCNHAEGPPTLTDCLALSMDAAPWLVELLIFCAALLIEISRTVAGNFHRLGYLNGTINFWRAVNQLC